MSVSVTMPRLGESVTEGTVTRWLKHEGDHVEADDVASLIHPHPTQSEALGEAHLALAGKPLHAHD